MIMKVITCKRTEFRIALLLSVCLLICCSGKEESSEAAFKSVIQAGGEIAEFTEKEEVGPPADTVETIGDEVYFCTKKRRSITAGYADFPLFNPNADIIYPGNLLQGATLTDATPRPIPVDRGPGTIFITVMTGRDTLAPVGITIPKVTPSNVFDAANDIIAHQPDVLPARTTFSRESISAREHLELALSASFENAAVDLEGSFKYENDYNFNRYLVKLNQSYYTIAFELPVDYCDAFAPGVTPKDLEPFIGPGNPPVFISSVTYGRMFYLLIQSTASREEMEAKIDASFSAKVASGSVSIDANHLKELENIKIGGYALGGDSKLAARALTGDFDAIKEFITEGGTVQTGAPLSYVARSLARPDRIVKVKKNTEYEEVDCIPIEDSFENRLFCYRGDMGVETENVEGSHLVTGWRNIFGDENSFARPREKRYGGELIRGLFPDTNLCAVRFSPSDPAAGALKIQGRGFVGTDYTLFAVVKLEETAISYPEYFIFGSDSRRFMNLLLGFQDWSSYTMSHQEYGIAADASGADMTAFNVLTFRFSSDEGMAVYINGESPPAASDGGKTAPLAGYLDAAIGSRNGAAVLIAEIRAYGMALSEGQREYMEGRLLEKYR